MTKTMGIDTEGYVKYKFETSSMSVSDNNIFYFDFNDGYPGHSDVRDPDPSGYYNGPVVYSLGWVRADDDYDNSWDFEYRAWDVDGSDSTCAVYDVALDYGWCAKALILTFDSPVSADRFRINAKSGDNLEAMGIQLFYDGSQIGSDYDYSSWLDNGDMTDFVVGGETLIDEVRIWFKLSSGTFAGHPAEVYDFELYRSS